MRTLALITTLNAKAIPRLEHVWIPARTEDLLGSPHPLRVVDAVNVVLDLEHHAPVLGDRSGEVLVVIDALRLLEGQRAVLPAAAVDLEGVLVGVDVDLDAGPSGGDGGDGAVRAPVVGA